MGRPRKLLENSTGDLTVIRRMQKMREEQIASDVPRDLLEEPPKELRDKCARDTWLRILPDLLRNRMTCNLDRDNLICYCNAWSEYVEAGKKLKGCGGEDAALMRMWHTRQKNAMEAQQKYGRLCGMTIDARLKAATVESRRRDDSVEKKFGVI